MLEVSEVVSVGPASVRLELPYERRSHSRLRADLDDGRRIGIVLPHGTVLRDGALLRAADGTVIEVRAAPEEVSTIRAEPGLLARLAYHLGNRHIALEVGSDYLRYLRDPVLDDLARRHGVEVSPELAPFEPEPGAYDAVEPPR
jgi:urease accessory protein